VEPGKAPKMVTIGDSLKSMQKIVGGDIEVYMPFVDPVAIICNEEGKINHLPLNRAVYGTDPETGEKTVLDIIAGTFFIVYTPAESENMLGLPEDLAKKYEKIFRVPDTFIGVGLGM
jgi:hypothetical protein